MSKIVNQNLPQTAIPPSSRTPWTAWETATWLAIVAGIAIRFLRLGHQSLWFDEGYTAWMVAHSPAEILRLVRADTAPPLYYFLLHAWTAHFGHSEAALRSLSALFSSLTLILAVEIARRILISPPAITVAAWLLAIGFHQPYYAQEARFYALMALLYVAALDCLQRHLAVHHRRWLIPISLILAAGLYTHNMMITYLPAFFLAWLVLPSDHSFRRRIADAALAILGLAILYAPWAIFDLPAQIRLVAQNFWPKPPTLVDVLTLLVWMFDVPPAFSWDHTFARLHMMIHVEYTPIVLGLILICASAAIWLTQLHGPRLRNALALSVLVLLPLSMVSIYSRVRTPILMDKTFLPAATLAPVLLLLPLTVNLSRFPRRLVIAGAIFLSLMSLSTLVAYETVQKKEDWRGAARYVQNLPSTHRLMVFADKDGQLAFDYYYHYRPGEEATGVPVGFFDRDPPRAMIPVRTPRDLDNLQNRLADNSYDEIVLVLSHIAWADPDGLTDNFLSETCTEESRQKIDSEISIVQFVPRQSGPRYAAYQLTSTAVASSDKLSVPAN